MKNLILLGKAIDTIAKPPDTEVWTLGTHPYKEADKYYELHGLPTPDETKTVRQFESWVYSESKKNGIPLNCTIIGMLILGAQVFKHIEIIGSPLEANEEYLKQRTALAYAVGFYRGRGVDVVWHELPENEEYGKK